MLQSTPKWSVKMKQFRVLLPQEISYFNNSFIRNFEFSSIIESEHISAVTNIIENFIATESL